MDSLRAQNVHKPLFKITQIESSIDSLSQANQVNINDKTITSDSDTLSEVTLSSVSSDENTKEFHSGKWSKLENILFLEGVLNFGNNWKKIQENIRTRTTTQARSHAQKIFLKIKSKNIVKIDSHVNTIQEFFKMIKKFPPEEFQAIYHKIIELTNEENKSKSIHKKRIPNKKKLFVVIHNLNNNNEDMKNNNGSVLDRFEGLIDKTEGTFNSTSSYKKEDDDFIEELLPPDVFIDIPKPLLNEDNDLDVIFSNL